MKYGIGIIGAGVVTDIHAAAIRDIEGATLCAVYDAEPENADRFADRWGVEADSNLDTFLSRGDIDVISVCTPSGTHKDVALLAAEAGKHLLIEKPLEVTVRRCTEISDACDRNGVVLGSVFQSRFHPAIRALKRAVDGGWFGRLSLVTAEIKWFRPQSYYDESGWRGTWALDGGGALMNQSIHIVDLLLWIFGTPSVVMADAALLTHTGIEVEDTLVATIKFPKGPLGTVSATTGAWPGSFKVVEVCGESGHVRLEEDRIVRWDFERGTPGADVPAPAPEGESGVLDPIRIGSAAHREQYRDLLRGIEAGTPPMVGAREATAAVELVERIYKAAGIGPGVGSSTPLS